MPWSDYFPATRIEIYEMEDRIMSAIDDLLNSVSDQLDKAKGEIVAEIDKLSANEPPSQDTIDRLRTAAQSLDDVVPDSPPEEPPSA